MSKFSKRTLETVASLRLIDDEFFRLAASRIDFCQELLQTLLDNDKIKVLKVEPQKTVTSLHREVILDVLCEDENGKQFNVEIQKGNRTDDIKRCRFHAAAITAAKTPKGTDFAEVPDVTVIYISDYDALGYGEALVKVKRFAIVKDKKEPFNDGEELYYANTVIKDGTRAAEFLELFTKTDVVEDDRFPATSDAINYYKNTEKGRESMCEAVQKYAEEYAEDYATKSKEEGRQEGTVKTLLALVKGNIITLDVAIQNSGLTKEEFDKVSASLKKYNE